MISKRLYNRYWIFGIMIGICLIAFVSHGSEKFSLNAPAQTQSISIEPSDSIRSRLQGVVSGILAVWDKVDVVCLGEDHGSKNDSDLRIALINHPDFVRKVDIIIVEFAAITHQDILDRFVLEGEDMPRDMLKVVWQDAHGAEVWESPIYEAFLRSARKINLPLPPEQRVRLLAGDNPDEANRGRFIREEVSRQILSKGLKALAIYGAGHCVCRGMGFPGELESQYPGKIWSVIGFYNVEEGRRIFGLGDEPKLITISGTDKAELPAAKMFFLGRYNDPATLGDITDAIVYYGDIKDTKTNPDKP